MLWFLLFLFIVVNFVFCHNKWCIINGIHAWGKWNTCLGEMEYMLGVTDQIL